MPRLPVGGPLPAGIVIAISNCEIHTGPWGLRIEDTVVPDRSSLLRGA